MEVRIYCRTAEAVSCSRLSGTECVVAVIGVVIWSYVNVSLLKL